MMNHVLTKEHYVGVKRIQRALLGTRSATPRPDLDFATVGLINFLGGKEAKLQALVRHIDVSVHEVLQPLKLLVEFISFVVGGLSVEADKIEEAICETRKIGAALSHEIQRGELEIQYRQQYTGTNVTRALAQFYRTKRIFPSVNASSEVDGSLQKLVQAIAEDRSRLQEVKCRLRALLAAQRLLWGSGKVDQENVTCALEDFSVTLAIRRFNHKLRDIMLPLSEEARRSLRCLESLGEFIAHVDIGLSAATEDLDACLVSLKKYILIQEEDSRVRSINAMRERTNSHTSLDASLKHRLAGSVSFAQPTTSATETEELSKLYCS